MGKGKRENWRVAGGGVVRIVKQRKYRTIEYKPQDNLLYVFNPKHFFHF